ncbi:MAG: DUF5060 domain-containing protein [Opitutaceae bacterium]|nr:DUF5060 domain-containing protein [Opitutaceae bacterium]
MRFRRLLSVLLSAFALTGTGRAGSAVHFSSGTDPVAKFGVHEIVLTGNGAVENPFDTDATITFTPPSGRQRECTVHAFYDGGNTWRARVFVSEAGDWSWASRAPGDSGLEGRRGMFHAEDSQLPGRLMVHPRNPRQWMTEDGRWFLNLNDTAYYLFSARDGCGQPVTEDDFRKYVEDDVARGITSLRSWVSVDPGDLATTGGTRIMEWNAIFADAAHSRLRTDLHQVTDQRLTWMLEHHPDIYVQLILLPLGSPWRTDSTFWTNLDETQKERVLRYLIARFAAFPQVFWLIVNDAHFAPDRLAGNNLDQTAARAESAFPLNVAFAREVGDWIHRHDPWQHPLSTGHARTVPWSFGTEVWATYIHLEGLHDLGAKGMTESYDFGRPVFLGEDRYERDRAGTAPADMRYFQRRLFWAWLLAGGSANYGGYWWTVVPYTETGRRAVPSPHSKDTRVFHAPLTGLDSVRPIRDYFADRRIELCDFEPAPGLAHDADGAAGVRAPLLMRRGSEEFLVYHPNAAVDGRDTQIDSAKAAGLVIDLASASGQFSVEWYRVLDGTAEPGPVVDGGGAVALRSPWIGRDVVLRLRRVTTGQ